MHKLLGDGKADALVGTGDENSRLGGFGVGGNHCKRRGRGCQGVENEAISSFVGWSLEVGWEETRMLRVLDNSGKGLRHSWKWKRIHFIHSIHSRRTCLAPSLPIFDGMVVQRDKDYPTKSD